jgi:hypothetical protein
MDFLEVEMSPFRRPPPPAGGLRKGEMILRLGYKHVAPTELYMDPAIPSFPSVFIPVHLWLKNSLPQFAPHSRHSRKTSPFKVVPIFTQDARATHCYPLPT